MAICVHFIVASNTDVHNGVFMLMSMENPTMEASKQSNTAHR